MSFDGSLVQCAPRQLLLAGFCEKFFRVLEVDDVGMVVVTDVVDGDTPRSN